ncbi:MAG: DUF1592 domain-containing protein [Polyangiales bacterium]
MRVLHWIGLISVAVLGCGGGSIDAPNGSGRWRIENPDEALEHPAGLGVYGLSRLSRTEYRNTVRDVFGVAIDDLVSLLPADVKAPFDNRYSDQVPSGTLIESTLAVATETGSRFVASDRFQSFVSDCTKRQEDSQACLSRFLDEYGKRALRRPLTTGERDELVDALSGATQEDSFRSAVAALMMDGEFMYQMQSGVRKSDGLYALNDYEIATRLAYFIWGSAPDDALLAAADAGSLSDPMVRQQHALRLLNDQRAIAQFQRYHAMWFGYDDMIVEGALKNELRNESDALVAKVIFADNDAWSNILLSDSTFVSPTLAQHYGMPAMNKAAWVQYQEPERRGLLSHGSFLSNGLKFGDTSPTMRGLAVNSRLLCTEIPTPTPENVDTNMPVNVDVLPGDAGQCKRERYIEHTRGGCASCHDRIDPIGFGLERFGPTGQIRDIEPTNSACVIDGQGSIGGAEFSGPGGLGEALLSNAVFQDCAIRQFFRFASGRVESDDDSALIERLKTDFWQGSENFSKLDSRNCDGRRICIPGGAMSLKRMDRRAFLRGAFGTAAALPWLEAINATHASAQALPKRFVLMFGGMSLPPLDRVVPATFGTGYNTPIGLNPIADLAAGDIRNRVSVVSNLLCLGKNRSVRFPQVAVFSRSIEHRKRRCSAECVPSRTAGHPNRPNAPTADRLMIPVIGGSTPFDSMEFCVQTDVYNPNGDQNARICRGLQYRSRARGRSRADQQSCVRVFNAIRCCGQYDGRRYRRAIADDSTRSEHSRYRRSSRRAL